MRQLEEHKVNPANDRLDIAAIVEPGAGGAHHRYGIVGFDMSTNPSFVESFDDPDAMAIVFQNGPIAEVGTNGVTHEALLAIVADRLRCFQAGPYACDENNLALANVESALFHLKSRTLKRMQRGVEGTHTV